MCWLMKTLAPDGERDGVLQVRADGQDWRRRPAQRNRQRRIAARAAQRRARGRAATRTIESSTWRTIGRSWTRKRSAMPPSRASASCSSVQIGSSERLPLVATTGRSQPRASAAGWSGVYGQHHAEVGVAGRDRRRHAPPQPRLIARASSTIGASGEVEQPRLLRRQATQCPSNVPEVGIHQRERLLLAMLAPCAARTAAPLARVHACRWKPPSPLTATICPSRMRRGRGAKRGVAVGESCARPHPTARAAGRTPGRRWAGRGSGGRRIVVLALARRDTSESPASTCLARS